MVAHPRSICAAVALNAWVNGDINMWVQLPLRRARLTAPLKFLQFAVLDDSSSACSVIVVCTASMKRAWYSLSCSRMLVHFALSLAVWTVAVSGQAADTRPLEALTDAYDAVSRAEALSAAGALDASIAAWRHALAVGTLEPQHVPLVTHNLGFTLQKAGHLEEALAAYEVAGAATPPVVDSLVKASYILSQTGRPLDAGNVMAAAVAATGGADPELLLRLGWLRNNVRRFKEASAAYRDGLRALLRASGGAAGLKARPQARDLAARLLAGLGDALLNSKQPARAAVELARALTYVDNATAGATHPASNGHGAAVAVAPPPRLLLELLSSLMLAKYETADWSGIGAIESRLLQLARAHEDARRIDTASREHHPGAAATTTTEAVPPNPLTPYVALFLPQIDEETMLALARGIATRTEADAVAAAVGSVGRRRGSSAGSSTGSVVRPRSRRPPALHLAYISRRFEDYPGTHLLAGVLRHQGHSTDNATACRDRGSSSDAARATTCQSAMIPTRLACFASGRDDESVARRGIQESCDTFLDVSAASAAETAAAIDAAGPDVLVDYDGAHDFNNMRAMALRQPQHAAGRSGRVHATWLGFPGTTGSGWSRRRRVSGGGTTCPSWNANVASVQLQHDGVEASTPPPAFDAALVDATVSPPELYAAYGGSSESLWLGRGSYQAQDPAQPLSAPRPIDDACPSHERSWTRAAARSRAQEGLPLAPPREPPLEPWERSSSGSSATRRDPVVLSDFNRWSKVEPGVWSVWMEVMRQAPHTVLWAYAGGRGGEPERDTSGSVGGNETMPADAVAKAAASGQLANSSSLWRAVLPPSASSNAARSATPQGSEALSDESTAPPHVLNLMREAAAHGVHPSRIVWAAHAPRAAHLWRGVAADIMLDTMPYGAHTTAADGLYTGMPLVTLPGRPFASRVGASLLRASGTSAEVVGVVHSLREYAGVVLALAHRPGALSALRRKLHSRVVTTCRSGGETCGSDEDGAVHADINAATTGSQGEGSERDATTFDRLYDAAAAAQRIARLARAAAEAAALVRAGPECPAWHIVAP